MHPFSICPNMGVSTSSRRLFKLAKYFRSNLLFLKKWAVGIMTQVKDFEAVKSTIQNLTTW
jgi:hypothetical protein